jgi:hypothetical protein
MPDLMPETKPEPRTLRAIIDELQGRIDEIDNIEVRQSVLRQMMGLQPDESLTAALNERLNGFTNAMTALVCIRGQLELAQPTESDANADPADIVATIAELQGQALARKDRLDSIRVMVNCALQADVAQEIQRLQTNSMRLHDAEVDVQRLQGLLTEARMELSKARGEEQAVRDALHAGEGEATINVVMRRLGEHERMRIAGAQSTGWIHAMAEAEVPIWKAQVQLLAGMLAVMPGAKLVMEHHETNCVVIRVAGATYEWRGHGIPSLAEFALGVSAGKDQRDGAMMYRRESLVRMLTTGLAKIRRLDGAEAPARPADHVRLEIPPAWPVDDPNDRPHPLLTRFAESLRRIPSEIVEVAAAIQAAVDLFPLLIERHRFGGRPELPTELAARMREQAKAKVAAPRLVLENPVTLTGEQAERIAKETGIRFRNDHDAPAYLFDAYTEEWRPHAWVTAAVMAGAAHGERNMRGRCRRAVVWAKRALLAGTVRQIPFGRVSQIARELEATLPGAIDAQRFLGEVAPRYSAIARQTDPVRDMVDHVNALARQPDGTDPGSGWWPRLKGLVDRISTEVLEAEQDPQASEEPPCQSPT